MEALRIRLDARFAIFTLRRITYLIATEPLVRIKFTPGRNYFGLYLTFGPIPGRLGPLEIAFSLLS